MSITAMKQALEALEEVQGHMNTSDWFNERVDALRTAIAEAEKQEPMAFKQFLSDVHTAAGLVTHGKQCKALGERLGEGVMRYMATAPAAQRQPLTDEQIDDIWNRYCDEMGEASINDAHDIARAIEAAHGIGGGE